MVTDLFSCLQSSHLLRHLRNGSLHLPKRPEIPERPPKYRKDQLKGSAHARERGEGHLILIFKHLLTSIFEYLDNKNIKIKVYCMLGLSDDIDLMCKNCPQIMVFP